MYRMIAQLIIWTTCLEVATEAVPCHDTHHCSDCDRETGDCLTDCDTGYYDRQCRSMCSRNCRNNKCVLSGHGNGNCTDGCVTGYYGIGCNIPCDSPGDNCTACPGVNCTACPGGCDGGYCQLGSSCVSGCVDSYYGTGCAGGNADVGLYVGLSGAVVSIIILFHLYWKYGRRFRKNNATQSKDTFNNVAKMDDAPVNELEWYTDIPLTSTVKAYESSGRKCRDGGGAVDVYDVADEGKRGFPPVIDNIYSKLSHA